MLTGLQRCERFQQSRCRVMCVSGDQGEVPRVVEKVKNGCKVGARQSMAWEDKTWYLKLKKRKIRGELLERSRLSLSKRLQRASPLNFRVHARVMPLGMACLH